MASASKTMKRGFGHYSDDGKWWSDDAHQRWFMTTAEKDLVEIEVEDYGGTSWVRRIFTTLFTQYGTLYYRFVARPRGGEAQGLPVVVASGTFPALPLGLPLDEIERQGAGVSDIENRFHELQDRLVAEGWLPAERGVHWWSEVYWRPHIDWDTPEDAYRRRSQTA